VKNLGIERFYLLLESFENYDPDSNIGNVRRDVWYKFLSKRRSLLGKKALELACGGGILSFVLDDLGLEIVGVDIQEEMIKRATAFAMKKRSNAKFLVGDVKNLDLGEKFDSIFIVGNSIVHFNLRDFEEVLKVVKKHLNTEGIFLIEYSDFIWEIFNKNFETLPTTINRENYKIFYDPENGCVSILIISKKIRDDLYEAERHCYHLWTPWILENVMDKSGFVKIERNYINNNTFIDIYKLK
jgi:SAM-dependent methyltransferase